MATELDRRAFLKRGGVGALGMGVLLGGGATLLSACGDDKDSSSDTTSGGGGSKDLGEFTFQCSWIKNTEFAGNYIADQKGYYKANGFSKVTLISGGPGVSQEESVASGKALLGTSGPDITGPAILKGIPLIALGALFQKNPFAIVSMAKTPINTAAELKGKKIGVQDVNIPIWESFLKANNMSESDVQKVSVQFDPLPLTTGEVDGWFSFITNEPNELKVKGFETASFLLADQGYPLVSQIYFTTKDAVQNKSDMLKAALKSDIQGWRDSIKDPTLGPKYAREIYGKDLKLEQEQTELESKSQNELILTDDTKANGIMTVTDAMLEATLKSLAIGGIDIKADQLFDFSILESVYKDNPELKTSPV